MDKEAREDYPTFAYRMGENGEVIAKKFAHPDDIPENEGWVNSPAKISRIPEVEATKSVEDVPPIPPVAAPGTAEVEVGAGAPAAPDAPPVASEAASEAAPKAAPEAKATGNKLLRGKKAAK